MNPTTPKPEIRWAIYVNCGQDRWFPQRVFYSKRDAIKWHNEFWSNVPKQRWDRLRRRGRVKCIKVQIVPMESEG